MIKITKDEAKYLRAKGYDEFVKKTYTKNPTYFCVEKTKVLEFLNDYRNSRKV